MTKVFGPALSIDAKKTLGKTITYQGRPTGHSAMKPPRSTAHDLKNPTASQSAQRLIIKNLVAGWQALPQALKDYWDYSAKFLGYPSSGYHLYLKKNGIEQVRISQLLDYWPDYKIGLVGYWPFGEGEGCTANDISGNANNGSLMPTCPADSPLWVPADHIRCGNALSFDGVDDYASVPHNSSLNLGSGDFTITFRIKVTTFVCAGSYGYFFSNIFGGNGFEIYCSAAVKLLKAHIYVGGVVSDPVESKYPTVDDGLYHNYILRRKGTELALFTDGDKHSFTTTHTTGSIDNTKPLLFMTEGVGSNIAGFFDAARIYNRALSDAEVAYITQLL